MAFITLYNLMTKISSVEIDKTVFSEPIYKDKLLYLGYHESIRFLAIKYFMESPHKFIEDVLVPYQPMDTFTLVYENSIPAFHENKSCKALCSDYINYKIPDEVIEKGEYEILEFRKWFKSNVNLLQSNYAAFLDEMFIKFCKTYSIEEITYKNSGINIIENLTSPEFELKINSLLEDAEEFLSRKENLLIALKYHLLTHLAYLPKKIDPGFPDLYEKEFRRRLIYFNEEIKQPLKTLLLNYFRVTLNPELDFSRTCLEAIGFKKCAICCY